MRWTCQHVPSDTLQVTISILLQQQQQLGAHVEGGESEGEDDQVNGHQSIIEFLYIWALLSREDPSLKEDVLSFQTLPMLWKIA